MKVIYLLGAVFLRRGRGYSWGVPQCGPPDHDGSYPMHKSLGFGISMDGNTIKVSSSSNHTFTGFLIFTEPEYEWSNISPESQTSGICSFAGKVDSSLSHTSSSMKKTVNADIACIPGSEFDAIGYIVTSYGSDYIEIRKRLTCPSI